MLDYCCFESNLKDDGIDVTGLEERSGGVRCRYRVHDKELITSKCIPLDPTQPTA